MTPKLREYLCESITKVPLVVSIPNVSKVNNMDEYFVRPSPIGCALRVYR